jgi:hypothetical protein
LVNPKERDRENEWISLLNSDTQDIDLSQWVLIAIPNHNVKNTKKWPRLKLGQVLPQDKLLLGHGEAVRVEPIKPLQLHNEGATIILYDDSGRQIDRVKYIKKDVKEGKTVKLYEYQPD